MLLNLLLWACDKPILDTSKPEHVVESPIHWNKDIILQEIAELKSE